MICSLPLRLKQLFLAFYSSANSGLRRQGMCASSKLLLYSSTRQIIDGWIRVLSDHGSRFLARISASLGHHNIHSSYPTSSPTIRHERSSSNRSQASKTFLSIPESIPRTLTTIPTTFPACHNGVSSFSAMDSSPPLSDSADLDLRFLPISTFGSDLATVSPVYV